MKINSYLNTTNKNSSNQSFKRARFIPESVGTLGKVIGEHVAAPEQKLILALSALCIQPLIDLKFAEEDKQVDSAIKTASKTIAGGLTGVTIRAAFIKLTNHFIGFQKHNNLNLHFFPDAAIKLRETRPELAEIYMKEYTKNLGTLFAILFMILFSNKYIDVTLTSDFQDLFSGVIKEDKSWLMSFNDVKNARIEKIKKFFAVKKENLLKLRTKLDKIVNVLKTDDTFVKSEEHNK